MDVLGLLRRLPEIVAYNKFDDDFLDRLNYSHTVAILTVFAIIATNRQFSENQIKCWVRMAWNSRRVALASLVDRFPHNSPAATNSTSIRSVS